MNNKRNALLVQYGCGLSAPASWRNFDASPTLRFERLPVVGKLYTKNGVRFPEQVEYGDIVKGLPLESGSCDAVYASHVLEHLALDDFRTALRNTYKLLDDSGVFRLVVPDLESLAQRYVASNEINAAESFMRETSLGLASRPRGLIGSIKAWLGNSSHLWMWDFKSLAQELGEVGFVDIRRCEFGDNSLFNEVEAPERFVDAVAVQSRKSESLVVCLDLI